NPQALEHAKVRTKKVLIECLQRNPRTIGLIKNPTHDMIRYAVQKDPSVFDPKYSEALGPEEWRLVLINDPLVLEHLKEQTEDLVIHALNSSDNDEVLKHVRIDTPF